MKHRYLPATDQDKKEMLEAIGVERIDELFSDIPESVTAPVHEGDVIGTATISYANQELTTINLIASETVELSKIMYFMDYAKKILRSRGLIIAVCVVIFLLIIYILLNKKMRDKKRRKRKR